MYVDRKHARGLLQLIRPERPGEASGLFHDARKTRRSDFVEWDGFGRTRALGWPVLSRHDASLVSKLRSLQRPGLFSPE